MWRFVFRSFLVVHCLILFSASMPHPRSVQLTDFDRLIGWNETHIKPLFYKYVYGLGTGQNWAMFAEIENYHDTWFEAEILSADGTRRREPLAHPSTQTWPQRFISMRDMFFFETTTGRRIDSVLKNVARWVARRDRLSHPAKGSVEVRFLSRWRPSYVYADGSRMPYEEVEVSRYRFSEGELL